MINKLKVGKERIKYLNNNSNLFLTTDKLSGMAWLEQKIWASYNNKVCADCGNKGEVQQESGLIKVVSY